MIKILDGNLKLLANDIEIKFKYSIEDNIDKVDMLICLMTEESISKKANLKDVMVSFTGGDKNDQYILFEKRFKDIFEDDNVNSFDDYLKTKDRANKIIKSGSRIYDISASIEGYFFQEAGIIQLNVGNKNYFVKEGEIQEFIKENFDSFVREDYVSKSPKLINQFESDISEITFPRELPIQVTHDFKKIFVEGSDITSDIMIGKSNKYFSSITKLRMEELTNGTNDIPVIKTIKDDMSVFTNKITGQVISKFNTDGGIMVDNNNVVIIKELEGYKIQNFYSYKGIYLYDEKEITVEELLVIIDLNSKSKIAKSELLELIKKMDNAKQLKLVVDYSENAALSQDIKTILLSNIDLLIEFDKAVIDEVEVSSLIYDNDKTRAIDYVSRYKLINKHYFKDISKSIDDSKPFLLNVYKEDPSILTKEDLNVVKEYISDSENLIKEFENRRVVANEIRTQLNSIVEENEDKVSDKEIVEKINNARRYLNRIIHISEEDKSNGKLFKAYPELKLWVDLYNSNYSYDLLNIELLNDIDERFGLFNKILDEYKKLLINKNETSE